MAAFSPSRRKFNPLLNDRIGHEDEQNGVSLNKMTLNLVTVGFGAGLLSLPWGVAGSSVIVAMGINAFVLGLNAWTLMLLVKAAHKYQRFDLGNLIERIPFRRTGTAVKYLINFLVMVVNVMALIGYEIVIYDSLSVSLLPKTGFFESRSNVILVSGLVLLPVCFMSQEYLAYTSGLSFIVNIYMFFFVLYELFKQGVHEDVCIMGFGTGAVTYFSAMMFSVVIQMCALPMYEEMQNRTPERFQIAVVRAFSVLFVFFSTFASAGYMLLGPTAPQDIMAAGGFPNNTGGNLARGGITLVVLGVFPLILLPIVAPVKTWANKRRGGNSPLSTLADPPAYDSMGGRDRMREEEEVTREGCWGYTKKEVFSYSGAFTLFCLAIVTGLGTQFEELGIMNVISGSISVFGFVAVAPFLIGRYLGDDSNSTCFSCGLWALLIFGFAMSIVGVIPHFTQNNFHDLDTQCLWKINAAGPGNHTNHTDPTLSPTGSPTNQSLFLAF